jgi:tetratricopeptide (TPR) repeat protein
MRVLQFVCVPACTAALLFGQSALDQHLAAAQKARSERQYDAAEREGAAAVQEAEKLGTISPRLNEALAALGTTYSVQRKYEQARPLLFRATEIAEAAGVDSRTLTTQLLSLANVQSTLVNWDQAELSLRRALQIGERLVGPDRAQTAAIMIQLAGVLNSEAKYEQAESYYRSALKLQEALFGPDNVAVSAVGSLGFFLFRRGRSTEAEPLLRRTLRSNEKVYGPESVQVASAANDLSLTVRDLNRLDEAEALLIRAIDIAGKTENSKLAQSRYMGNLSLIYQRKRMLPEAETMAESALRMRENLRGPDDIDVLPEIEELAGIYADQGKYEQAEPLRRRALAILETNRGPEHPDVATACMRLGGVLYNLKRYSEMMPLYRRAVEINEKRYGPHDLKTASAIQTAANIFRAADQYAESEALFKRTIAIEEADTTTDGKKQLVSAWYNFAELLEVEGRYREAATSLEKHVEVPGATAIGLAILGDVCRRQGFLAKANEWLTKSIDADDQRLPTASSVIARLRLMALVDHDRRRYSQAAAQLQQALVVAEKAKTTFARTEILEDLGNIQRDTGQFAEAAKLYGEVLTIRERESPDRPAMAQLLDNIALMLIKQSRLTEAEPQLLRARRIYERAMGSERPIEAPVLLHLAMLYRDQKRYGEAEQLFKRAIELEESGMSPDAPALAPALREFAQLYRAQNRIAEASALEQRAKALAAADN